MMPELGRGLQARWGGSSGQTGAPHSPSAPQAWPLVPSAGALHCMGPTRAPGLVGNLDPSVVSPGSPRGAGGGGRGERSQLTPQSLRKVGSPCPGPLSQGGHAVPEGSDRVPIGGSSSPASWAWSQLLTGDGQEQPPWTWLRSLPSQLCCCDRHTDVTIQSWRPEFHGQGAPWLGSGED